MSRCIDLEAQERTIDTGTGVASNSDDFFQRYNEVYQLLKLLFIDLQQMKRVELIREIERIEIQKELARQKLKKG